MNYAEAVAAAEAGKAVHVSAAGGRSRYVWFTRDDDGTVSVRLFSTTIAEFRPSAVTVYTGGYNTATTVDALNAICGPLYFGTFDSVLYVHPYDGRVPFTEGMRLSYSGKVLSHGTTAPPARPGRRTRRDGVLG